MSPILYHESAKARHRTPALFWAEARRCVGANAGAKSSEADNVDAPTAFARRGTRNQVATFSLVRWERLDSSWRIAPMSWSSSRSQRVLSHGPAARKARLAINWPK